MKSLMFLGIVVVVLLFLAGIYWVLTNIGLKEPNNVKIDDDTVNRTNKKKVKDDGSR